MHVAGKRRAALRERPFLLLPCALRYTLTAGFSE
jgi:hypothetical protein